MIDFTGFKAITIPEGSVKKITAGGVVLWEKPSGYTNLFDSSASGFVQENSTRFYTNWIPYSESDNGGAGTMYHFKGLKHNSGYTNPYKVHWAEDANGKYGSNTNGSLLKYTTNSDTPPKPSDYDPSVTIFQDNSNTNFHYIRFEIREALPNNLIITANEPIT